MPLRLGFQIAYRFAQPTPMVAMLDIHDSHAGRVIAGPSPWTTPDLPLRRYRDRFGNTCTRLLAPAGLLVLQAEALVREGAEVERAWPGATQVASVPAAVQEFLRASRYCEVRPLQRHALVRFGELPSDRVRVQAICAHVARTIEYAPESADCTRGAMRALQEGKGVCRDFAHAAIALCRAAGIPARYCMGYPPAGGDASAGFSAWFEAWVDGQWTAFDARTGGACPARIALARGRDAADAATSCAFGPCEPERIQVWSTRQDEPMVLPAATATAAPLALAS